MGSLPNLVEDLHGILQLYSDGSVFRSTKIDFRNISVVENPSVEWKDILYNHHQDLHLRLYKPVQSNVSSFPIPNRLPILYYLHGGGFCLGSRTWPNCHNCCMKLAAGLNAVVISPDYRLAPEHRLPAAIDDIVSAVEWLQGQALSKKSDAWLSGDTVDFDKTFILGDSSGGNIAHHLAVKFEQSNCSNRLVQPVRVRGFVMMAPFFGGVARTKSEAEGPDEELLNLEILDRFWRLSLPEGETRDHPLVNPFSSSSPSLKSVKLNPILVIVGGNEIMKDRIEDYAKRLQEMEKEIEYVKIEGKQHGFFTNEPASEVSDKVLKVIQKFMYDNSK